MMHKIDILLATYNGDSFLAAQLDSILNQSFKDWKLIVRDDGSTDTSMEILLKYQDSYPHQIMILANNNKHLGVSLNFSKLLETSTAPYLMFCDQDDTWLPNKIEITLEKMKACEMLTPNVPLLIHSDLKVVDENLDILSDSYWAYQGIQPKYSSLNRLLVQNVFTGCSMMINRNLSTKALPVPQEAIMHDWWIGLVASSFGEIHALPTATVLYRQHDNNDTGATVFNFALILRQVQNIPNISLSKYTLQAKPLLSRYNKGLSKEQKELLQAFIGIEELTWIKGKLILLKYNIFKQNIFKNIGLLFSKNK